MSTSATKWSPVGTGSFFHKKRVLLQRQLKLEVPLNEAKKRKLLSFLGDNPYFYGGGRIVLFLGM